MRKFGIAAAFGASALVAVAVLLVGAAPQFSGAADHLDAPGLTSPGGDGRLDINDVYAFKDGGDTVLIMTVNPLAGVASPTDFHPDASYEFNIDTDGDAKKDLTYKVDFGIPNATQPVRLRCVPASACAGPGGAVLATGQTESTIPVEGGGSLFVGLFDDPFFFDLLAFLGTYAFCTAPDGSGVDTGDDFFAGFNVSAIVLKVPSSTFPTNDIGVWGTTKLDGQIDRLGRPAINTVFIPSASKDAFNEGKPRDDVADFSAFLAPFDGVSLPDILTVDTSDPAGFLNGRKLADDVIDIELTLITGAPAGDCVDANDVAFPVGFPYLAPAH